MKQLIASRIIYLTVASTLLLAASITNAQQPVRHELIRGDMPPGLAADYYRMSHPSLANHVQPVRVITPLESRVEIAIEDGFIQTNASRVSLGMQIGPVYRFKVTDIPQHPGKELYPLIEILNRLHPPEGLENEFPVEIVLSQDDLKQAIAGRLVTKVVYLENPETTLPHRHMADQQPYFDVGGSQDPLRSAEKLGRPMAILRIGSRIPLASDRMEQFNFNAPQPTRLPDPQTPPAEAGLDASAHAASLTPVTNASAEGIRTVSHFFQEPVDDAPPSGFSSRDPSAPALAVPYPTPLATGMRYGEKKQHTDPDMIASGYDRLDPRAGRDEYVFDGDDRGVKVHVDQQWNVGGLQTEDTIGHFDTLDGRRLVTPSNRVAIYAPRFGAVRKLDGVFNARLRTPVGELEEKTPIALTSGKDLSSTTKQNFAVNRFDSSKRASGFVDRTRGVLADNVTHLFGVRNTFDAFENLSLIRIGKFSNAESARLNFGIQSALAWEDNLGLQVVTKKASPIIVRDVKVVEELVRVESKDGSAILRVTKIASKIAARTGEIVDFTIRFDNLSGKPIGNVTIIDNLTRRLEYVPESAESSLKADFIHEDNDGGSLMLRWEITQPLEPHSGGLIRFQCRVR